MTNQIDYPTYKRATTEIKIMKKREVVGKE